MHKIAIQAVGALLFGLSTSALAVNLDAHTLGNSLQKSKTSVSHGSMIYGGQDISRRGLNFQDDGAEVYQPVLVG